MTCLKGATMFAFQFSFNLRYHRDVTRSIQVPLDKLAGINFAGIDDHAPALIMAVIEQDDALLNELFGDFAADYRQLTEDRETYWKELMRFDEELVLVAVEDAE
jgi:hypothetical protein